MTFVPSLQLTDGPACPRCGCRDSRILQMPTVDPTSWYARATATGRARCNHCGLVFAFRGLDPQAVDAVMASVDDLQAAAAPPPKDTAYPVRACPECGSPDVRVKSSPKPKPGSPKIRYHECANCLTCFKSVDRRKA